MLFKLSFRSLLGGALAAAICGSAQATEHTVRGTTAATIPHPELAPHGIHLGGYTLFPSFNYLESYNDNILATESNQESSRVTEFLPAIRALSDWSRHSLNFNASASIGENQRFSSEDYTDWNLGANGRLNIRHDIELVAGASFAHEHVDRSEPDETRGIEPTEFDRSRLYVRYWQKFGRYAAGVNLNLVDYEYDDNEALRLGVPVTIDNSFRDRTQTRLRLRGSYNHVGNQRIFISLESFDREYDESTPPGGTDRSSDGLESKIGLTFDYHGILAGEVSIGYRNQDYEGSQADISAPLLEADMLWNITDLTTLHIGLDHEVVESIQQFTSSYQSTSLSLGLDHELRRNLIVNLNLIYTYDDFETVDPFDRDDNSYYLAAGTTYRMNRNLYFNFVLVHEDRNSDFEFGAGSSDEFNYTRNLISFAVQAQL